MRLPCADIAESSGSGHLEFRTRPTCNMFSFRESRMKRPITLALLFLTLLFGGLAIFAVLRIHAFAARPALIPSPEAVPNSYFGMTLHNYNTTTPLAIDSVCIFTHLGYRRDLGRYSANPEYLCLV